MLQSIRDGLSKQKWLAYLVVGVLALVFAAWGAYGIVNLSVGGGSYAAEAGGQKVTIEAARNAWVQQLAQYQQQLGGELPPEQKLLLQDHLLESMIREALLTQRARDLGYRISEKDVIDALHHEPAFQVDGVYNPTVAKDRLQQAGIAEPDFETELRGSLQRAQLQSGIAASDFLTPMELQRARALKNEEREVRYVSLPADQFAGDPQPDDAAIQAYYKAHAAGYMLPESVNLHYAELRLDQVAAQIKPTEAQLRAAYEKNKDRYVETEKRHARHILIPVGKDDAAAHKQADNVFAQAKAGKDFAALAKQYSQDPGSADKGGDLGWADRNQFVGPFTDALFGMAIGEIRGPVKTQFGYHIIRLDEIQPGKAKSFEQVRPELEAELKRNAATDRFGEIQEQIQARLEQAGGDLDTLGKQFSLQIGDVPQFLRGAGGAPLGAAPPLQEILFGDSALPPGHIGGPVLVGEDRLVLATVKEHRKSQPKPLAEVRDSIVAAIRKDRGSKAALKAAQDAQVKLVAGASVDEVAKSLGVTAEPARFVGRNDPSIPTPLREVAFAAPRPTDKPIYQAIPLQAGGAALVVVTKVRTETPAAATPEQQQEQAKQQLMQAKQDATRHGQADTVAYVEEMRRTADVRKNPKAFE
jgi:peptidyl-prolyl cis-trans isomerase D